MSRIVTCTVTALLAAAMVSASADAVGAAGIDGRIVGWRHDGRGKFPDATCPTSFSTTENVIWKTKTKGWSNSSPVIVGERIFITEEPFTLVCLSAEDGRELWRRDKHAYEDVLQGEELKKLEEAKARAKAQEKELRRWQGQINAARAASLKDRSNAELKKKLDETIRKRNELAAQFRKGLGRYRLPRTVREGGYSTPTPVSDGRNVYAIFGNDILCSYDLQGTRRWAVHAGSGSEVKHHACRCASQAIIDGKLIAHVDATHVYAFDLDTGQQLWNCPAATEFSSPAVAVIDGLPIVVSARHGEVIDARSGTLLHTIRGLSSRVGTPVFEGNILYMAATRGSGWARAFKLSRTQNGIRSEKIWECRPLPETQENWASPLVHEGLMYRCTSKGKLNVIDMAALKLVYSVQLRLRKDVYTSPTLIGKHVFLADEKGRICIFEKGREYREAARFKFEPMRSCPVAVGNRLYIRALEHVYCIGKR